MARKSHAGFVLSKSTVRDEAAVHRCTIKVGYDPLRDLAPVGIVSSISQAVILKKDLPVKTLAEFVSYAKVLIRIRLV